MFWDFTMRNKKIREERETVGSVVEGKLLRCGETLLYWRSLGYDITACCSSLSPVMSVRWSERIIWNLPGISLANVTRLSMQSSILKIQDNHLFQEEPA